MKLLNIFQHFICVQYTNHGNMVNNYYTMPRPFHNLFLLETGKAELTFQGKKIALNKGNVCYIPKGSCYISKWYGADPVKLKTVHFIFNSKNDPFINKESAIFCLETENLPVFDLMNSIFKNQSDPELFALVLADFFSLLQPCYSKLKNVEIKNDRQKTEPAVEYLKTYFWQPVSMKKLADLCYLSESRFYSCFKSENGCSPVVFKNKLMIEQAICNMIEHPHSSIEQIATNSGFSSVIYFRRLFKKITGWTPSEYMHHNDGI